MNRVHTHTHNKKQNDYNVSTLTTTTNYSKQNRTYCIISMSMKISLLVIFYHIIDVFIIFEYQKTIKPLTVWPKMLEKTLWRVVMIMSCLFRTLLFEYKHTFCCCNRNHLGLNQLFWLNKNKMILESGFIF